MLIASRKMSPPSNNPPFLQSTLVFTNRLSDKPIPSMQLATESASKYSDKLSLLTSAPDSAYELSSRVMPPSAASAQILPHYSPPLAYPPFFKTELAPHTHLLQNQDSGCLRGTEKHEPQRRKAEIICFALVGWCR